MRNLFSDGLFSIFKHKSILIPGTYNYKRAWSSFFLAILYGIGFYVLQLMLFKCGLINTLPSGKNIIAWDANWYQDIVINGSQYWGETNSSAGFFPLFPMIWKLLHLNGWGISFLNLIFFATGFGIFNYIYDISIPARILFLSIPSLYFVWVPYTEALFVLLTTLTLLGIINNNTKLIWSSLFLLALCRPTTLVLIPAFLIMELATQPISKKVLSIQRFLFLYASPLLLGLGVFILYQYFATGVWFAYFKLQSTAWGHKFALPTLPFNSMFGPDLLWLNAIALFIGLVAFLFLVRYIFSWLFKNVIADDKPFILSCLYFTGISLVTILFNPTWETNSTNVFDIHRYAFVSPFFWVLLHRFIVVYKCKTIDFLKVLFLSNLFWLSFGHYENRELFFYFNSAGAFIILYMLLSRKEMSWLFPIVIIMNVLLQVHMFQGFISNVYPG